MPTWKARRHIYYVGHIGHAFSSSNYPYIYIFEPYLLRTVVDPSGYFECLLQGEPSRYGVDSTCADLVLCQEYKHVLVDSSVPRGLTTLTSIFGHIYFTAAGSPISGMFTATESLHISILFFLEGVLSRAGPY